MFPCYFLYICSLFGVQNGVGFYSFCHEAFPIIEQIQKKIYVFASNVSNQTSNFIQKGFLEKQEDNEY